MVIPVQVIVVVPVVVAVVAVVDGDVVVVVYQDSDGRVGKPDSNE